MKEIDSVSRKIMLEVDKDFSNRLSADWESIKAGLKLLEDYDTKDLKPLIRVYEGETFELRDDVIGEVMSQETILENAPSKDGQYVSITKVVNHG